MRLTLDYRHTSYSYESMWKASVLLGDAIRRDASLFIQHSDEAASRVVNQFYVPNSIIKGCDDSWRQ